MAIIFIPPTLKNINQATLNNAGKETNPYRNINEIPLSHDDLKELKEGKAP